LISQDPESQLHLTTLLPRVGDSAAAGDEDEEEDEEERRRREEREKAARFRVCRGEREKDKKIHIIVMGWAQ